MSYEYDVRYIWGFWLAVLVVAVSVGCLVSQPKAAPDHWVLRATSPAGVVLDEAQGQGCSVYKNSGRVWVGNVNNEVYSITVAPNAPVFITCTKL